MAMVLPGVSYDETLLTQASGDDPVTMPLFIGYTLPDVAIPVTAMQPVSVGSLTQAGVHFGQRGTLAYSLRHFFENGGRQCYVLSLGPGKGEPAARLQALIAALQAPQMLETLLADDKTGLILVPELSELNEVNTSSLSAEEPDMAEVDVDALWYQGWQALLTLCRQAPQRFALLELPDSPALAVKLTQQSFSADLCQRGAAWWPRLETTYQDEASAPVVLSPLPAVAAAIQRSAYDTLSVYWSVRASSALDVTWWYYQGTKWASLDAGVQDDTAGLSVSNLWRARLPADSQPGGDDALEAGYYWVKGTLTENKEEKDENTPSEVMPKLQAVLASAMTATLNVAQAVDDSHFAQPLPANTVSQLVKPVAAISDVRQPLPSAGGQPRETEAAMLQRAATRIAHRQRAITWSNMRSLLMEHYPEIFDVRFPDVDKLSRLPALEVQSLMVIPDGRYGDNDDALRPLLSDGRLSRMAQWLAQYTSLWAAPTLKNPKYIDVTARYRVTFVAGIRPDYGYCQLAAQLQHDYIPWANDRCQAVTPGNQVDYYQLLATLQQSPLVQSVNALVLIHDVIDDTGKCTRVETQSTVTARDDEALILCPEGEPHV